MAVADVERSRPAAGPYEPWLQRVIRASGLAPWQAGIGLAALQLVSLLVVFGLGALAGLRDVAQPWFWSELAGPNVVNALLIGYAPAALAWSRRAALAQLERLRPLLAEPDFAAFHTQLSAYPRAWLALAGGAFAAFIVPLAVFDPTLREFFERATPLARIWQLWVNALVGWLMARSILEEVRVALLFARLGDRVERIHAAARSERDALLAGGAGARLPALLALRSQVAEVREWPVDLSTLLRLLLYLGIGLGSWVGAALVDVSIEALLR